MSGSVGGAATLHPATLPSCSTTVVQHTHCRERGSAERTHSGQFHVGVHIEFQGSCGELGSQARDSMNVWRHRKLCQASASKKR